MKKHLLFIFSLLVISVINAQEEGKLRVGMDIGYAKPSDGGGGLLFNLEPKYNIAENMIVGLRLGTAIVAKNINYSNNISESPLDLETKISAQISYMGTFDYHFHKSGSDFSPFVGVGLGFVQIASFQLDSSNLGSTGEDFNNAQWDASSKFGGLIRGGFEYGKLRLGIEYNLIPNSNLKSITGKEIGTAKNGYFGFSIGFYLGGGKWNNS